MKLSRYMDIEKYKDLLSTKTLYFPRYDQFEDKLEGSMQDWVDPNKLVGQITRGLRQIDGRAQDGKIIGQTILEAFEPVLYENVTFVSCWHRGVTESSLMWKTYTEKDKRGVMIKSDLSSLESSLKKNRNIPRPVDTIFQDIGSDVSGKYKTSIRFGEVKYLPLGEEISILGLDRYLCKQKPYADEKEFRVVVQVQLSPVQRPNFSYLLGNTNVSVWNEKKMSDLIIEIWNEVRQSYKAQSSVLTGLVSNCYVRWPVDITSLIKEVVINPYGNVDSDMREIQALNNEFGLSAPVRQSEIKTGTTVPTTFFVDLPDGRTIQT